MSNPDVLVFSRPHRTGLEQPYMAEALASDHWHGDGPFTRRAHSLLEQITTSTQALLTTSCTHALELSSLLLDLGPGDEVVVPSFTFSSTAAAIAIRGATPVFCDVRPDTLNIDVDSARRAITDRTKALFVLHYGGVAADMDDVMALAREFNLPVVEDNAHALGARWKGQHLGTFGALATQSFHTTKNVACGEGGALLINADEHAERAEIIREKGTNRALFLRGQVDKYTWIDQGSSYLPSEALAAVLVAQLEHFDDIQRARFRVWDSYHAELAQWAAQNRVEQMHVPEGAEHPAHVYYVMMPSHEHQMGLLGHLKERGIIGTFHYLPLDQSPAGQKFGRTPHPCPVTGDRSMRLVRLPLFADMTEADIARVVDAVREYRVG